MVKRTLALLLTVMMIFSTMSFVASADATITGTIGSAEVTVGSTDEILIPITLTGSYGSHDFFVTYDKDKLDYVGYVNGKATFVEGDIVEVTDGEVELATMTAVTASNEAIVTLKFKLAAGAVAGDKIVLSYREDASAYQCFFDSNWNAIEGVSIVSGWVKVKGGTTPTPPPTPETYTITFVDEDGTTVLETLTVEEGQMPVPTVTPTKAEDEVNTYAFECCPPFCYSLTTF